MPATNKRNTADDSPTMAAAKPCLWAMSHSVAIVPAPPPIKFHAFRAGVKTSITKRQACLAIPAHGSMPTLYQVSNHPDETRTFDHGQVEVMKIGGAKIDSCQAHHVGYVLTGRLHVLSDDGGEAEIGPGEAYDIEPGHDGWVVGDEAVTSVEFSGAESYAKRG